METLNAGEIRKIRHFILKIRGHVSETIQVTDFTRNFLLRTTEI